MIDISTIGVGIDSSQVKVGARDLDNFGQAADAASRKADSLGASATKNANRFDELAKELALANRLLGSGIPVSESRTRAAYAMAGATQSQIDELVKLERSLKKAEEASNSSLLSMGKLSALLGAAFSITGISHVLDEYTKFTAQLRLATRSAEEYSAAYQNVISIARSSQSEIGSTGVLYARLNNALRELGVTQSQVSSITETVALSLRVSGATAAESASAMLQLSQAFGSGVLRGEEFNAVNEAAPGLMRALAESLGVPIGALRKMASEGELTSDVLAKAYSDPKLLASLREQAKEVQTISSGWTALKNELTIALGEFDKAVGISSAVAGALIGIAQNLDLVAVGAAGAGTAMAFIYAPAVLSGLKVLADAFLLLWTRITGPLGIVAALGVLGAEMYLFRDRSVTALDRIKEKAEEMNKELAKTKGLIDESTEYGKAKIALNEYMREKAKLVQQERDYQEQLDKTSKIRTVQNLGTLLPLERGLKATQDQLKASNALIDETIKKISELESAGSEEIKAPKQKFAQLTAEIKSALDIRKEYTEQATAIIAAAQEEGISNEVLQGKLVALTDKYYKVGKAKKKHVELNDEQKQSLRELQREIDLEGSLEAEAYKKRADAQKDFTEGLNSSRKAVDDLLSSAYKQIESTQQQIDEMVKGKAAVNALEAARLRETSSAYAQNAAWAQQNGVAAENVQYMKDMASRFEDLAVAREKSFEKSQVLENLKDVQAANKKSVESMQREYERMSDNINRALTDALMRGFDSGKSFAENFRDTLVSLFKTLVLQPVVKFLVDASGISSILGTLSNGAAVSGFSGSSVAGGSSSGLGSIVSLAKNIYSGITAGFDSLNASLVGKIGDLGTFLVDKGFNNLGGMIGQYNTQIASALPYSAAVLNLLQGNTTGAALSAAGAFLGNLTPLGPIGGAIGASIGSMVGGLFGGGAPLRNWAQVTSKYDTSDTFKVTDTLAKRGGTAVISPLTDLNKAFSKQLDGFMEAMGSDAALRLVSSFSTRPDHDTKAALSGSINGKSFSLGQILYDENDTKAWSKYVSTVLGKGMVAAIRASNLEQGFKDLFKGFTGQEGVTKLMGYVIDFKNASEELMDTYGITAETAAKIARQGGSTNKEILAFTQAFAEFSLGLMKQSEQILLARNNFTKAMNDIIEGVSAPDSLDGFDAILASIDTSTKAGQKQFADLFKLRDTFSELTSTVDNIKSAVKSSIYDLLPDDQKLKAQAADIKALFEKYNLTVPVDAQGMLDIANSIDYTTEAGLDLAAALPSLVEAFKLTQSSGNELIAKFKGYADSLKSFGQSLVTGSNALLSPNDQYVAAKAEFEKNSALAAAGNDEALANFQTIAQAFLDASKAFNASSQGYFNDLEAVKAATSTAQVSALAKADVLSVTDMTTAVAAGTSQANVELVTELQEQNTHLAAMVRLLQASQQQILDKLSSLEASSQDAANAALLQAAS
ncbi:tape measure protein [Methylovorus glucosotrophus]|uniref:Phage tape measure protein n=1 Tax=Methylovorus glucosotrophus (strain SIP3-4) TaxID=582744 RepID=C6XE88_METGS|nr:tape measure protein [Methylovorus glucosotrophus]ACT50863.1 phage tape measure protein [Methylovorus glucosotrophus SIP3-4]